MMKWLPIMQRARVFLLKRPKWHLAHRKEIFLPAILPRIEFYCEVAYGGHFWNIYSIYSIELVRKSGSLVKKFDGTIDAWLRGAYQIEYKINGDFYNYATKEVSGTLGGEIKLGEHGSISFSLSGASSNNFYAYCYEHKTAEFTSY